MNGFSVIMPTYNQGAFIRRAIQSLIKQSYQKWELIIINDGCTDNTEEFIVEYFNSELDIKYIKNQKNQGLGYAINQALDVAKYEYISYLPSDDFYFKKHLEIFNESFTKYPEAVLVFNGVRFNTSDSLINSYLNESKQIKAGYCLQLVQTAHRKTNDRWVDRNEWVSENLFYSFWRKLTDKGLFYSTKEVTCQWTNHPEQRHKIVGGAYGGNINFYRSHYNVNSPVKLKVSNYKFVDEEKDYISFRKKKSQNPESLKILLVGELSYNPERIYALEEQGNTLYGLWIKKPRLGHSTIGPLPFGNITDLSYDDRYNEIKRIKPDIIYAQLNFESVTLAHDILKTNPDIPFVWHFKEGPLFCIQNGLWTKLLELYAYADGKIYLNKEVKDWFEQFTPNKGHSFLLDGDLPKIDYFGDQFSEKLSVADGAIHTFNVGRMIGLDNDFIAKLAQNNIHIHHYALSLHDASNAFFKEIKKKAPNHFHIHLYVTPWNWTKEFSKYDAGWLHCFESKNNCEIINAGWDDLNLPARMSTYAAAGVPMILKDNSEHIVAMQSVLKNLNMGIYFKDADDLSKQLYDNNKMKLLSENAIKNRFEFSFDYHVPQLISFFHEVIKNKSNQYGKNTIKNS